MNRVSNIPESDIWRLTDNDPDSQNYRRNFKLDFTFFESEAIKDVVKKYIWMQYSTGNRVLKGLRESLWQFKYFNAFCRQSKLSCLRNLTNNLVDDYRSFLRLYASPFTGKPLSYNYQRNCFSAVKTLVGWCHVFLPDAVPIKPVFVGGEYRNVYDKLKIDYIPDEILEVVNESLKTEENPYLKYGMIILEYTGIRLGDLLLLKIDCISEHPISGYTISWFDHKNRKYQSNMPIPKECKEAVDHLIRCTESFRNQAEAIEKEQLFIYKPLIGTHSKPIVTVSKQVFTKWCKNFSEKHNICGTDGKFFRLTSHMFRRTLATNMLSKGMNIKVIQEVLGHSSPKTTKKYYADMKDASRTEIFSKIGILGNIQQVDHTNIPDQRDLRWFQDNCMEKARLADGFCTLPIQEGKPCGHFLSRQKCYLCSRYITTLEDLDEHKQHLAELEKMLDSNIYGAHYAAHFLPTTFALKEIIRQLEELRSES